MRVIAFVPNRQLLRLKHGASSLGHVVDGIDSAISSFRFSPSEFDVVVLNPAFADRLSGGAARRLLTAGIPIVIYVAPADVRAAVYYVRCGAADLVVEGIDDAPSTLNAILTGAAYDLSGYVLASLDPRLRRLQPSTKRHFCCLCGDAINKHARRVLSDISVSDRSLHRYLSHVGLPSAKVLIRVACVVRAYRMLSQQNITCEGAARTLGYSSGRRLSLDMKRVLKVSAETARHRLLSPSDVIRLITAYVEEAVVPDVG